MQKHIIFGISPFNTKFNESYLCSMLEWGFAEFDRVDVLHPYEEARYLLMACGNAEVSARKKGPKGVRKNKAHY